jgi:hypothetical protein
MRRRGRFRHFEFLIFNFELFQPFAQSTQSIMRARNHLDADDPANLGGGGGTGVSRGFHGGDIAPKKHGDVTTADFFPASDVDVRGFKRGVGGFHGGAESLAFNHSNSLF